MVAVPLPVCDINALKEWLYAEYQIEVPISTWNGTPLIRVSIQVYNTQHDVDQLITALADLLPQVRTG